MPTRYNKVQAAHYLHIGRRTLYRWLAATGSVAQRTFTKGELDELASRHGKSMDLPELRALRVELVALRQEVADLRSTVSLLQQHVMDTPQGPRGAPPPVQLTERQK